MYGLPEPSDRARTLTNLPQPPFIPLWRMSRECQICFYLETWLRAFLAYVTFVMYPKVETSRNVEIQGKEPDVGPVGGLGRLMEHFSILKLHFSSLAAHP